MAKPIQFDGANKLLNAPEGVEDVSPLAVFTNDVVTVSCWELTDDELMEILLTRKVWVSVKYGSTQPPIFVGSRETVRQAIADWGLW